MFPCQIVVCASFFSIPQQTQERRVLPVTDDVLFAVRRDAVKSAQAKYFPCPSKLSPMNRAASSLSSSN